MVVLLDHPPRAVIISKHMTGESVDNPSWALTTITDACQSASLLCGRPSSPPVVVRILSTLDSMTVKNKMLGWRSIADERTGFGVQAPFCVCPPSGVLGRGSMLAGGEAKDFCICNGADASLLEERLVSFERSQAILASTMCPPASAISRGMCADAVSFPWRIRLKSAAARSSSSRSMGGLSSHTQCTRSTLA